MKKIRFFNALALVFILATPLQSSDVANLQSSLTALKSKLAQLGTALHELGNPQPVQVVQPLTAAEISKLGKIEQKLIAKITTEASNISVAKTTQVILQELHIKYPTQQITWYCSAEILQNYNLIELQALQTALNATMDANNAFWTGLKQELEKDGYDITDEWGKDDLLAKTKSLDLSIKSAIAFKITPISHYVAENLAFLAMLYLERDGLTSATVDSFTQLPGNAQNMNQAEQETIAADAWTLLTLKEKQIVEKCLTIKTFTINANETTLQRKIKELIKAATASSERPATEEIQKFYGSILSTRTLTDLTKKEPANQKYKEWREKLDPIYLAGILYIFAKDANQYKRIVEDKNTQARENLSQFFKEQFIKDLFITDPCAQIFGSTIPADNFWSSLSKTAPSKPSVSAGDQAGVPSSKAFEEPDIKDMALVVIETKMKNKKGLTYQDINNYLKSFPSNKNVIKAENFNITIIKESTLKTVKGALEKLAYSKKTTSQDKQEISILLSKIDPRLEEFKQAQAAAPDTKETPGQTTLTQEQQDAAKAEKIKQSKLDIHNLCEMIIKNQASYSPQKLHDYFISAAYQLSEIVQIPELREYLEEELQQLMDNKGARKVSKIVLQKIFAKSPPKIQIFLGIKTQGTMSQSTPEPQIKPTQQQMKGSKADIDAMAEQIAHEEIQNPQELHHFFNNPNDIEATYQLSEIVTIPELFKYLQVELSKLVNDNKFSQATLAAIFDEAPTEIKTYIDRLAPATPQTPPLPDIPGQPKTEPAQSLEPQSGPAPAPQQQPKQAPIKILSYNELITAGKKIFDDLSKLEMPGDALISRMQHEATKTPHKALETFIFQKYNDNAVWFDQIVGDNKPGHEAIIKVIQEVKHALESTSAPSTPAAQNQKSDLPAQPGPKQTLKQPEPAGAQPQPTAITPEHPITHQEKILEKDIDALCKAIKSGTIKTTKELKAFFIKHKLPQQLSKIVADHTVFEYFKVKLKKLSTSKKFNLIPHSHQRLVTIFAKSPQEVKDYIAELAHMPAVQTPEPASVTTEPAQEPAADQPHHQGLTAHEIKQRKIILYKMYKDIKASKKALAQTIRSNLKIGAIFTAHPEMLSNKSLRKYLNKILYSLKFDENLPIKKIHDIFSEVPDLKDYITALKDAQTPRPKTPNNPHTKVSKKQK